MDNYVLRPTNAKASEFDLGKTDYGNKTIVRKKTHGISFSNKRYLA